MEFSKTFNYGNGIKLVFSYVSDDINEFTDLSGIKSCIEAEFGKSSVYNCDVVNVVRTLRIIFKDYSEKLMTVYIVDGKAVKNVGYRNMHLVNYLSSDDIAYVNYRNDDLEENKESKDTLNFSFNKNLGEKINISDFANKQLSIIESLKDIRLYTKEDIFCELYNTFYKEAINLDDDNIDIKMQAMLSVLNRYLISLGDNYFPDKEQLALSIATNNDILEKETISLVSIVGEAVLEDINSKPDKIEALKALIKPMDDSNYILSDSTDVRKK